MVLFGLKYRLIDFWQINFYRKVPSCASQIPTACRDVALLRLPAFGRKRTSQNLEADD